MTKILLPILGVSFTFILNAALSAYPASSNQGANPTYNQYYQNSDSDQDQYNQNQNQDSTNYNRNSRNSSNYMQTPRNNPSYYNQSQDGNQNNSTNTLRNNTNPNNMNNSNPNNMNPPEASKWSRYNRNQIGLSDDEASAKKSSVNKYPQDSAASETDRQLNVKIRNKIAGWFTERYNNIALNTANGVVNIGGTAMTQWDITNLLNEIRKIDGVRNIISTVQITKNE